MEVTGLDHLIEEITEKEMAAKEMRAINDNRGKIDTDQAKAEETRKKATEGIGQTRRRLSEDVEVYWTKQKRSESDTIEFLRERSQIDKELIEKELE